MHHLSYGGWIGTLHARGRQQRELQPADLASKPGLVEEGGPYELARAMFHDALRRESHKSGAKIDEGAIPAISRQFALNLLLPIGGGQEATFTAEFLRRWFDNRRHRMEASA